MIIALTAKLVHCIASAYLSNSGNDNNNNDNNNNNDHNNKKRHLLTSHE